MSGKGLLVVLGVATLAGVALASNHAKAAAQAPEPPTPEPLPEATPKPIPDPLPAQSDSPDNQGAGVPSAPGAEGGAEVPARGNPTFEDVGLGMGPDTLPDHIRNINLSGLERIHYAGPSKFGAELKNFDSWVVNDSLNGMDLYAFVSKDDASEYISMFKKIDPPGSEPFFHMIVYKVSETPNKLWMIQNIAGLSH